MLAEKSDSGVSGMEGMQVYFQVGKVLLEVARQGEEEVRSIASG